MTDASGPSSLSGALSPSALETMAEEVERAMGRFHPGRPAFSALSWAGRALRDAAREVDHARRTYAPVREAPSIPPHTPDA
jgi:hypothetical protein